MKRIIITLSLFTTTLFFNSCNSGESKQLKFVCSCTQQEKLSKFIENSIKPSNNMSDEEMEDVIHELLKTGIKSICGQRLFHTDNHGNIDWNLEKLDSCEVVHERF